MRNLYIILFLIPLPLFGQMEIMPVENNPKNLFVNYGISGSINYTIPIISKADLSRLQPNYTDSLQSIWSQGDPGFGLGMFLHFKLGKSVGLRPQFQLHGNSFKLFYKRSDTLTEQLNINMTYLSFPVHFIISPWPKGNYRPTFTFGPDFKYLIGPKRINNLIDFSLDFGVGFEKTIHINNTLLSISPELKYSVGLTDIIRTSNNFYNKTISNLSLHTLSLTVYVKTLR